MQKVVIVSAARTAVGAFCGSLTPFSAVDLGVFAAKEAIKRANIDVHAIDEVVIGNVLSAGLGQNVARQVAVKAGLPVEIPAMTINKLCGSALRAVSVAYQFIKSGEADCLLCGGTESMTNAPYLLKQARTGYRMGSGQLIDSLIHDGLVDAFHGIHMGMTAENVAERWGITREQQDAFAVQSQNKAQAAQKAGKFKDEIVPITVPQRKGAPVIFDRDEFVKYDSTLEKIGGLKGAFKEDGTVTAANASGINDGAAMFIVMSKDKAEALGIPYLAEIAAYASKGIAPDIMGCGPTPTVKAALQKANWAADALDLVELNEAFAAQSLAVIKDLGISPEKTNVNGGAIAIGHPIGASGGRILATLLYEMKRRDAQKGLAALCIGGGMGTALLVERTQGALL